MEYQNFIKSGDMDILKAPKLIKQYLNLKKENPDSILLFQVGSFYETYFEDAITVSKVCGINLTKRKFKQTGEIPLAGVPVDKGEIYIKKLVENGFKVTLTVQRAYDKKGDLIEREIVRTYSKGTLIEEEFLDGTKNNFLVSVLKEGNRYGLSYCDVSTGEFFVTEGNFEEILCELSKINISEILLKKDNKIEQEIYKNYPVTFSDEEFFNENFEFEDIKGLALKCVNSIINYTKYTQKNFTPKLNFVKKYSIQSKLIMNGKTRENIELNRNLKDKKHYGTIIGAIDTTKTLMGKRLLRSWLNEPMLDEEKINERLDSVEELIQKKEDLNDIKDILDYIQDTFRLSAKLSNGTVLPKELLYVKNSIKMAKRLDIILKNFKSPILNKNFCTEILCDYEDIIERTIKEEPNNNLKSGGIIKQNANGTLDNLKMQIAQYENEIFEYENELKNLCGVKNLKIGISKNVIYTIDVPVTSVKAFLSNVGDAIRVQKLASLEKFTTKRLQGLEEKITSLKLKTYEIEYNMFLKLREYSKEMTDVLREFSRDIAKVDVLCSFADFALKYNCVKPKFVSEYKFNIQEGLSPVLLSLGGRVDFADIYYDENEKTKILTGANMSGKSTYLREQAALVILAQAGSFVPCKSYRVPLIDRIFLRMGSLDDTLSGNSAFMLEMKDVYEIINYSTEKSLVLLDEIGKSTSFEEGSALAYGIIKYITEKIGAKTTLVTHFHNLNKTFNKVKGVKNYCFNLEKTPGGIRRKLEQGQAAKSFGFEVAKDAGIPNEILKYAENFLQA